MKDLSVGFFYCIGKYSSATTRAGRQISKPLNSAEATNVCVSLPLQRISKMKVNSWAK